MTEMASIGCSEEDEEEGLWMLKGRPWALELILRRVSDCEREGDEGTLDDERGAREASFLNLTAISASDRASTSTLKRESKVSMGTDHWISDVETVGGARNIPTTRLARAGVVRKFILFLEDSGQPKSQMPITTQ